MARRLIALLAVLGVAAAACAEDPSLDAASVTEGLTSVLFPADSTIPADVDCADPDPQFVAQTIICSASLHGRPITIDVAVDEEGTATAQVRERLLSLVEVQAELGERLIDDLGTASVDVECPGQFVVDAPGVEFDCVATHDDRPLNFVIEIIDTDSTWTATLVPQDN